MRFLVDQNLPTVLCDWLVNHGQHAEHIKIIGMRDASDTEIIRRARETNATVITRDSDFISKAGGDSVASWLQLVWVRLGNVTNPELILLGNRPGQQL
jgi:predicted nuclease of predicted toxin-antitoxin system